MELRHGPLDFIEIHDGDEVLHALDKLRSDPALFNAMAANGLERGKEFCVESIRARWLALLEGEVLPAFAARAGDLASRRFWHLQAMAAQKAMSRVHRARIAYQRWSVRHPAAALCPVVQPSGQGPADNLTDVSGETFGAADRLERAARVCLAPGVVFLPAVESAREARRDLRIEPVERDHLLGDPAGSRCRRRRGNAAGSPSRTRAGARARDSDSAGRRPRAS